jgi:hypothetical protein
MTELAAALVAHRSNRTALVDAYFEWLNGKIDGGPNGDGRYPLTRGDGTIVLVPCPALGLL